jgi:hypothetical protein
LTEQAASLAQRQPCASPGGWQRWFAPQVQLPVAQSSGAQPSASAFVAPTSQCVPTGQVDPSLHGAVSHSLFAPQRFPAPHDVAVHGVKQMTSGPVAHGCVGPTAAHI